MFYRPPLRGVAMWVPIDSRGVRLSRVPPMPPGSPGPLGPPGPAGPAGSPVPPVPFAPRGEATQSTQRLCSSHTGCVPARQGSLLLHNNTIGAVQMNRGCTRKQLMLLSRRGLCQKHQLWQEAGQESTIRAETMSHKSCDPRDAHNLHIQIAKKPKNQKNA